ncbi:hypothetical protein BGZ65_002171 [Modicella reniformis]|uniref:Uncharacterized protein n=1 Tax=Modicella reniformis TaxID=1440133 RepID=A0A9P6ILS2_9FUNG|nr:hypothetical protein BGZ65_002171 [Modicella reniformis]
MVSGPPDSIPKAFMVEPVKDHDLYHKGIRINALCHGPSITNVAPHVTSHGGYTVTYPRHKCRKLIKAVKNVVSGAPGHAAVDNRDRLDAAGINRKDFFSAQSVVDDRKGAMEVLLREANVNRQHNITGDLNSIVLDDGQTIWVCTSCLGYLQGGEPIDETTYLTLPQYISLANRGPEMDVTLHNPEAVALFTEIFTKKTKTTQMIICFNSEYLPPIQDLFNKLGTAFQNQKMLVHLKIYCNTNNVVYTGLQSVLSCQYLETLHVSGIPSFLQGDHLPMKCKRLKELELQGVHVNMEQYANNLRALIGMNPGLKSLTVTCTTFTNTLLETPFLKPEEIPKQFAKLAYLNLSYTDLDLQQVIIVLNKTLERTSPKLKGLTLSHNPNIGETGGPAICSLLLARGCQVVPEMEGNVASQHIDDNAVPE